MTPPMRPLSVIIALEACSKLLKYFSELYSEKFDARPVLPLTPSNFKFGSSAMRRRTPHAPARPDTLAACLYSS